jgi:hypothetical protein
MINMSILKSARKNTGIFENILSYGEEEPLFTS